jgi:hypothetical protein
VLLDKLDGTAELAETGAGEPPEPEPAWPGQRYYARDRRGRETEIKALRNTDAALPHRVGQVIVGPGPRGGRARRYVVTAVEEGGDRVVLDPA